MTNIKEDVIMDSEQRDGFKVLLTDDSKMSHVLMKSILKSFECFFDSAMNGLEAVEKIKAGNRYNIIFMDSHMPVMDGITAIKAIRQYEEQNGLPPMLIIMMSADDAPSDIAEFLNAGASDYLQKPISKNSVMETFNKFFAMEGDSSEQEENVQNSPQPEVENETPSPASDEYTVYVDQELEALIPIYIKHRRDDMPILKQALAEKDFDKLQNSGHSLKGSGGGYGMHRLTELGAELETSAKNKDINTMAALVAQIEDYLSKVVIRVN